MKNGTNSVEAQSPTVENTFEFNSYISSDQLLNSIFGCGITKYFTKEEIDAVMQDPIANNKTARDLANLVYRSSGTVSSVIDYMVAMPQLQSVITYENENLTPKDKSNKKLMLKTLSVIDDSKCIRDALFTELNNGIFFYYFDTKIKLPDNRRFLSDLDIDGIIEINEVGLNATLTTLPIDFTRIIGKKNGRYVLAFDLEFFDQFTGEKKESKLRKYPKDIVDAYKKWKSSATAGHWVKLDNNKTMCCKMKSKDSDPWGLPLAISALNDLLYQDQFLDMKRSAISDQINNIFYQTLPADKDGKSLLTRAQQEEQHNTVKSAVMNKNNVGGTSFFTVAPGTKFDKIKVDTDIFDSKLESDLSDKISLDLGVASVLIGSNSTGNFSSSQNNLEMINAFIYRLINDITSELNYVINANIIKDCKHKVEAYYLPLSFVNKSDMVSSMKDLYMAGGSYSFWIAATGVDIDKYYSVLQEERNSGLYDDVIIPHPTSFNTSGNDSDDKGGRPPVDNPTNENTIQSKSNASNKMAKPSTR